MDIKDILLVVRLGQSVDAAAFLAGRLAQQYGASVNGLCLVREPPMDFTDCYAWGPVAVGDVLARIESETLRQASPVEMDVRKALKAWSCPVTWSVSAANESAARIARRACLADLVLINRPHGYDTGAMEVAESLLLAGGAPCLLVPPSPPADSFSRIVVGWNSSRPAKMALDASLPFLRTAAKVEVVRVGEPNAEDAGQDVALQARLERHGVVADLKHLEMGRGNAGDTLLRHCEAVRADLLVMGAYGRSHAAEVILGGATQTVLTHARLPVLMFH